MLRVHILNKGKSILCISAVIPVPQLLPSDFTSPPTRIGPAPREELHVSADVTENLSGGQVKAASVPVIVGVLCKVQKVWLLTLTNFLKPSSTRCYRMNYF